VTLRRCRRAAALAWALAVCMIRLGLVRLGGPLSPERRALWLQSASRGVLSSLGIQYSVHGTPPSDGLVVSNHLSYLDILIHSSVMPCAFVSKTEINKWPYFGVAARAGGTLFIDRSSRASVAAVAAEMTRRLKLPIPVLLFPEGTSTDGSQLLPFHTSLFEPAVKAGALVTPAAVRYVIQGGVPESELCWYGNAPFLPHLWKALGTPGFSARVAFGTPAAYADRREASRSARAQVSDMRGIIAARVEGPIKSQLVPKSRP
jgi:1-acyl-sn-glycerol-3-phosphate acyltransferase